MAVNLIDSNDIQVSQIGNNIELQIDTDIKNEITQNTSNIATAQQDITNLENGNVYDESEVKTNEVWINGKPIYKKVLYVSSLPNNTGVSIQHGISNIDLIWLDNAFWHETGGATGQIPMYFSSDQITNYYVNQTVFFLQTNINYSNRDGYIILKYTKTTD